jgi:anti-sigma regulatory factor (Ser/Thr protein kinase)
MPFSSLQKKDFFGRQVELASLYKRVLQADNGQAQSVVLSGRRGMGKTELIKHLFSQLFWGQERIIPFLYTVNPALLTLKAFSKTYLVQFICQRLAFEKKDQSLLYREGISFDSLSTLGEDMGALWVKEILDQYLQCSGDPMDEFRIALLAPHRSVLSTGTPVAVLIDDFHLVQGLHLDGVPDHRLVSFFQVPMSHGKIPHIITGNMTELQEMTVVNGLERMPVPPLGSEPVSSMLHALLNAHEAEGNVPPLLLRHLGGNPYYIGRIVARACAKRNPDDQDFWSAYIQEIMEGTIALSWSAVMKSYLPDLGQRRTALSILSKIYHTTEVLSCQRIMKIFSLTDRQAHDMLNAMYLAGLILGEFGGFCAIDDRVLRDVVDALSLREIQVKSAHDMEVHFLESLVPQKKQVMRFDMTIPIAKEAELIVAQSLEQIGKNLSLNQDAIGKLQIAVIEACINAIEHGRGVDDKVYVSVVIDEGQMEVSIESAGHEFIIQETGEPYRDQDAEKKAGRGWGIKLMKRFVDHVRFEKTSYGTKIVLVKKMEKAASIKKEDTAKRE